MSSDDTHARAIPDEAVICQALGEEVVDKEGAVHKLGDLIDGKRTCLVFIRHFCESLSLLYLD